jgi:hypothetical protein
MGNNQVLAPITGEAMNVKASSKKSSQEIGNAANYKVDDRKFGEIEPFAGKNHNINNI